MILLLGGTAETSAMAGLLAPLGRRTLALTATSTPLDTGQAHGAVRRAGKLDKDGLLALIRDEGAEAVVDVAHPYAAALHANARAAADEADIPYLAYSRPEARVEYEMLYHAESHQAAAELAFSLGGAVLLTTGSRNLTQYARMARHTGKKVVARVLDDPESLRACQMEGFNEDEIIAGRGPFSIEANLEHIEKYEIGALVTKDSGAAGGVPEKIEAARLAKIPVVMVSRPAGQAPGTFADMESLVAELRRRLGGSSE